MSAPVRVTVNLASEVVETLRSIAARRGCSVSEALSRAIGSELFFTRERAAGARIIVARPDGELREVLPY